MALVDPPQNTPLPQLPQVQVTQWGEALSKFKMAFITQCDENGNSLKDNAGNPMDVGKVWAILTDGEFTVESQYTSPFENINPESRLPTLLGMLQAGELAVALGQITSSADAKKKSGFVGATFNLALNGAVMLTDGITQALGFKSTTDAIESLKGRTNLTKINSTQIFVSTTSVKIPLTLFFMALRDAKKEVEDQISQLQQWAVPVSLSSKGLVANVLDQGPQGLFPSYVPPFISLTYGGKTYKPFLIESVSAPLVVPLDKKGNRLSISVTLSICSRTAWDAGDIKKLYGV